MRRSTAAERGGISVVNLSGSAVRLGVLRRAALAAARASGKPMRLSIAVVGDRQMRRLHGRFSGDPSVTDVLAWPMSEKESRVGNKRPKSRIEGPVLSERSLGEPREPRVRVEGEIAICRGVARREAEKRGHPLHAELALYVVHGVLHLAGYDDHEARAKARMWAKQREILDAAGFAIKNEEP